MFPNRPFSVTLLLSLVLMLSAWGATRFAAALRWWDVLVEFGSRLSPGYFAVTGLVWTIAGITLCWSIIARSGATRWRLASAAGLWQAQWWIERVFYQSERSNLAFALIASAVLLAVVAVAILDGNTIRYFSMSEEHEQADQSSKTA